MEETESIFFSFLQNVMASEFKEKINNVFGHLAGKGGVVTDDSLRRFVRIEFHEMSPHLTLHTCVLK